ncbi:MAG: ABC transporter substrate-binding protein [Myxococcota bacterium]
MRIDLKVFVLPFILLNAPATTQASEPVAVVRSLVSLVKSFEGASASDRRVAAAKIHGLLDIEGLAQRSLLEVWGKLNASKQSSFVALFRELLAKVAYPQSAKFFKSLELEYEDAGSLGDKHNVLLSVTHPDEGLIEIEFLIEPKSQKVHDISIDGVSLALDIRAQMQKIVAEESFEALEAKMKKRIVDAG